MPLLWVLFLAYAWLVVGFAMTALSGVAPQLAPLALHAFTAGAMGSMTLGMMTRVSLGHTGRPLVASLAAALSFAAIILAGLVRVLAPVGLAVVERINQLAHTVLLSAWPASSRMSKYLVSNCSSFDSNS